MISPWGLAQKLLKSKPNVEDSQPETDDLERRTQHLEKLNQFYEEYVITVPLSNSIKVEQKQDQHE